MQHILIIGAKSDVAQALAKQYAQNGYGLFLSGKNINELSDFANDLAIRHDIPVHLKELDLRAFESHQNFYEQLDPRPFGVIVVAGYMTDQLKCQKSWQETLNTIIVNYTGAVSILNIIANDMEQNKEGFIVGISSVAGDRGRKANYIYGSSKAGFSAYLSGLRNRLYASKVQVLSVKPGFIDTKMTKDLDLPPKLTAKPEEVAKDIFTAQQKGKDVLYTKAIWRLMMAIITHIPEKIFKKMSI